MEKTIYVNPPASRTWNCLGVNEAAVRWDTDAETLLSNERFTAVSGVALCGMASALAGSNVMVTMASANTQDTHRFIHHPLFFFYF